MSDIEYNEDDFPDFDAEVFDDGGDDENPYVTMGEKEFRLHIVGLLDQCFKNQESLHEATKTTFETMEKRQQELLWMLKEFQKKVYGDSN